MTEPVPSPGSRRQVWIAAAVSLLFLASRFLAPGYIDNETTYAIGPIRMLHPAFLAGHPWLPRVDLFFVVFDSLASPFYLILDPLAATLVLRVLIWAFELWALWRLLGALGVRWWAMTLMLVLWIDTEQTLVAGEWVFGCASAKPVAYGFLFLAVTEALGERYGRAGLFMGIAASFHVLVGGWGIAALGAAILVVPSTLPRTRRAARFAGPAFLASLPGLLPAVIKTLTLDNGGGSAGSAAQAARIYVTILTPFHLDPAYFMSGPEYVKVFIYLTITLGLCWALLPRRAGVLIVTLLAMLAALFAFGLIARRLEWFFFLKYYPFRVADGLYPLFFWTGIVLLLQRLARVLGRWALPGILAASLVLLALVGAMNAVLEGPADRLANPPSIATRLARGEPRASLYWIKEKALSWRGHVLGRDRDDFARMEDWVRVNTPPRAVFIIPPWQYTFPVRAQRIEFLTFKSNTDVSMASLLARWDALSGGDIGGAVGWGVVERTRYTYPRLTTAQLLRIGDQYRVDYVITATEYEPVLRLVHQEGDWRLYRLSEASGKN